MQHMQVRWRVVGQFNGRVVGIGPLLSTRCCEEGRHRADEVLKHVESLNFAVGSIPAHFDRYSIVEEYPNGTC